MMNELMDMVQVGCEEAITDADEARLEHERGEREGEAQETWASLVATHGPLMTDVEWKQFVGEYADYLDMGWKD